MNKTSVILIAAVVGIMLVGMLAVTLETGQAFAFAGNGGDGGDGSIGVNGGHGAHGAHGAHDPCDNAGPAEHNPHCQ
jgi:hypothetical protein